MAELRHSSSMGNRTPHTPSPIKRDASAAAKSFFSSDISVSEDNDDAERRRSSGRDLFLKIRRLLEDPRNKVWVLLGFGFLIMFGSVVLLLVWRRLSSPYLCYRDGSGIGLRCPEVKEATSLWENPYASTVSWKPCAERQVNVISVEFALLDGSIRYLFQALKFLEAMHS